MYAQVKLLNGFQESLWYEIPHELKTIVPGSIVVVPLRARTLSAYVEKVSPHRPRVSWQLRSLIGLEPFPHDPHYAEFIRVVANYYQLSPLYFAKRLRSILKQANSESALNYSTAPQQVSPIVTLTQEQQDVVETINTQITQQCFAPLLLHGLTGSGKTEVYKKAILHALSHNKSVIVLLPEVSLAVQFTALFAATLSGVELYGFHSATSVKEKRALWNALMQNRSILIVGVHLPIMLPINNLGLIIVDEEHEAGYQEKKHPRINSKEAALMRAQTAAIPVVLGSATPSISSLYAVRTKKWRLLQLTKRYAGSLPQISVVPFTIDRKRPHFWMSKELCQAIADRLQKKEQTILFLNRRGHSFFVQCKQCGASERCPNCSVTLTLHDYNQLLCHYCNFEKQMPQACPGCRAADDPFIKRGIGTQQLLLIVQSLFPAARIARADVDSTVNKKKWKKTVDDFHAGEIDILIGTQTITKGYHFPRVTLVGVVWADLNLNFPHFNASETALQQLIQVAGRAGRASHESEVIVQTMAEHQIFSYLSETDYMNFYDAEIEGRELVGYPPCIRFVEIELKSTDAIGVEREAHELASFLRSRVERNKETITVLGPARPLVHMIKNLSSRKIYLKCVSMNPLISLFQSIDQSHYTSSIYFTPNPLG